MNVKLTKLIYCARCENNVIANQITGKEVYPHLSHLSKLKFRECLECYGFVSSNKRTGEPLGIIATDEMKKLRMRIHETIDPIWKEGLISRSEVYTKMSRALGISRYHTANLRTLEEHNKALVEAKILSSSIINSFMSKSNNQQK